MRIAISVESTNDLSKEMLLENDIKVIADYKKEIEIATQWLSIISKEQGANSEAAQRQRDYINDLNLHLRMYKDQLVEDNEALEKAKGHYGQFDNAAKYIDPRHE